MDGKPEVEMLSAEAVCTPAVGDELRRAFGASLLDKLEIQRQQAPVGVQQILLGANEGVPLGNLRVLGVDGRLLGYGPTGDDHEQGDGHCGQLLHKLRGY